ncbi:hypothetical protein [Phenylobacterium sp. J367]|uniref:hypothetical protein n=1 Tax=Phenylobacterium sp. J367 TaxID=2898435 RepID=UPI002151FD45|nr:hypothetical protein [Phenylobacterium sp. J367]MCR5879899.1 hypothetical protein [Phenylobacterium sp. J367]
MDELARLLVLLALAGVALTVVGTLAARLSTEDRKIRRSLKKVLKADPHAMLVAPGRGRGVGFNFTSERMAVCWDTGAWCLVYRIDEMVGAELIIDGQVTARAHRGEARRALDLLTGADELVRLRLIFDDPRHPDFDLDLWLAEDEGRRGAPSARRGPGSQPLARPRRGGRAEAHFPATRPAAVRRSAAAGRA